MNARRLTLTTLASLCALATVFALAGASAEAFVTHRYVSSISSKLDEGVPATGPHGESIALPGPLGFFQASMIIDSGHLWIAEPDPRTGEGRIDEFDAATGAFISQFAHGGFAYDDAGIAVGHSTGEAVVYAGGSTGGESAVAVFDEAGARQATWTGAATPAGSFGGSVHDVAVDNSTSLSDEHRGDVFVVSAQGVIDIFHPEADGKEHYVGQLTGPAAGELFSFPFKLAVNAANGDIVVNDPGAGAVDVLEPATLGEYALAHRITATPAGALGETYNVAVDSGSGDVYLTEGFGPVRVDQFSAAGAFLGRTIGADTPIGEIGDVYSFTVDPESHDLYVGDARGNPSPVMDVFGPGVVIPDVGTQLPGSVTPSSATLEGTVNPDGAGAASCQFDWGTSKSLGKVAPCEPEAIADGSSPVAVHAALSGLEADTTYFYRLRATNANGTNRGEAWQDQEFTTPGPRIDGESVSDVSATSVTFEATINPHGAPASAYFQYGTSSAYGTNVPAAPGEAIGSGESDTQVAPHKVQGLQAGTVYHYRVVVVSETSPGVFEAYDGPDATFTTQTPAGSTLLDGRQWEMVSPPDKKGASIQTVSDSAVLQAAADGSAFTYLANAPIEAVPQGSANASQVLSTRGPDGWSSHNIANALSSATGFAEASGQQYRFFSSDLSLAALQPYGDFVPQLSPEASEQTSYLATLSCSGHPCYRPLVTGKPGYANVPAGTAFGGGEHCLVEVCGVLFVDATPDLSHVVVEAEVPLTADAAGSETRQLYEWAAGKLTHISVLPEHGGPARNPALGSRNENARGAISSDGSRIVFEAQAATASEPSLYLYDATRGEAVQLDVAEAGCVAEGKCSSGGGVFAIASADGSKADGSKVFFTDAKPLTSSSGRSGTTDLYECELIRAAGGALECKLTDLTPAAPREVGPPQPAEAQGVVGASEDGSYMYFVANGVLASGAVQGTCGANETAGHACDLYVRHDGATKLLAVLPAADQQTWGTSGLRWQTARVSPDGQWLAFMSHASLTGYDNHDAETGAPDTEVYLYDASAERLVCASCNPTGARPVGVDGSLLILAAVGGPIGLLQGDGSIAANVPGWTGFGRGETRHQPRYLSDSGRLFFDSNDALVPQDVNGTQDAYEYEPTGVGNCAGATAGFSERTGGCVSLLSAGTSAEESAFLDASESGGDAFFMTFLKLAPQDYDASVDVYDAHECTTASPCIPTPVPQPPACTTAEACRAAPTPQPALFGAPSSATFSGAGNVSAASAAKPVTVKSLTRAQKLARALKTCKRKPKKKRAACEKRARAQYGPAKPRKSASKKGKR
jgi:hypothetical protein